MNDERVRVDCRCLRAKHEHGTRHAYNRDRCRCDDCTRASAVYAAGLKKRKHLQASGILPATHCDGTGARRRLQALAALGWTTVEIGAELGITGEAVQFIRDVDSHRMYRATADRIAAVYDRLSMRVPPKWTRYRTRVQTLALRRGWAPPLAWDDDEIDDPGARPNLASPRNGWEHKPCGTSAAYRRHRRRGESPCRACLAAERRRVQDSYRKKEVA